MSIYFLFGVSVSNLGAMRVLFMATRTSFHGDQCCAHELHIDCYPLRNSDYADSAGRHVFHGDQRCAAHFCVGAPCRDAHSTDLQNRCLDLTMHSGTNDILFFSDVKAIDSLSAASCLGV